MVRATFLGHAAVALESDGRTLLIDPYLTGNPLAAADPASVSADAIFVSHGHSDHLGDAIDIAKRCNCPIVASFELASYCHSKGAAIHPMHIGGRHDFGWFALKLTPALHGSTVMDEPARYVGNPTGALVEMGGFTIYHAGDTALTMEMELLGRLHSVDLAFLPIGDNFTMGVADAAEAVRMIRPRKVVPMHYNTFGLIEADPAEFAARVAGAAEVVTLKPGDSLTLS